MAAKNSWSREETNALKRAVNSIPVSVEKQERWRRISNFVGTRGKRECYEMYKQLKEERKSKKGTEGKNGNITESKHVFSESCDSKETLVDDASLEGLLALVGATDLSSKSSSQNEPRPIGNASQPERHTIAESKQVPTIEKDDNWSKSIRLGRLNLDTCMQKEDSKLNLEESEHDSVSLDNSTGWNTLNASCTSPTVKESETISSTRINQAENRSKVDENATLMCRGSHNCHASVLVSEEECLSSAVDTLEVQRNEISYDEANSIRDLLFNDRRRPHTDAWKKQGIYFCDREQLRYGLVQREGGPCGVLAVLNAFVLRSLIFSPLLSRESEPKLANENLCSGMQQNNRPYSWQDPNPGQQRNALLSALTHLILTSATAHFKDTNGVSMPRVIVCLPNKRAHLHRSSAYFPDGFSERLQLCTIRGCSTEPSVSASSALAPALYSFLNENIEYFNNPTGFGTLLLLYSCILSRGIANCKSDMDDGFAGEVRTLCDRHNYLSQEGVNLLLHGRAVSNVFDGDKVLQDDVQGSTVSMLTSIVRSG